MNGMLPPHVQGLVYMGTYAHTYHTCEAHNRIMYCLNRGEGDIWKCMNFMLSSHVQGLTYMYVCMYVHTPI